jgi:hypothetical protein
MGLLGHRLYWFSKTNGPDGSHRAPPLPKLLWKNFSICPHCRRQGRPDVLETLDEDGPIYFALGWRIVPSDFGR